MNRGMRVLQTLALPLGYVTVSAKTIILYRHAGCQERNAELPELAGFNMYLDRLDQLIPACFHITKPYMGRKRGSI